MVKFGLKAECMFTWVCPDCGAEVDVAEKTCPRCKSEFEVASTEDTADKLPRLKETPDVAAKPAAFALKPTHLAFFVVAVIAAVALAVYFSQPSGLQLEDLPEDAVAEPTVIGGSGTAGPIEVTGLRFRYDDAFTPLVQAVVINHSNRELYGVRLAVELNTVDAPIDASPLATFEVALAEPLAEQASVEVEAKMLIAGTIEALPPTDRLRVEVKRLD
jgi:hypothetical protein